MEIFRILHSIIKDEILIREFFQNKKPNMFNSVIETLEIFSKSDYLIHELDFKNAILNPNPINMIDSKLYYEFDNDTKVQIILSNPIFLKPKYFIFRINSENLSNYKIMINNNVINEIVFDINQTYMISLDNYSYVTSVGFEFETYSCIIEIKNKEIIFQL